MTDTADGKRQAKRDSLFLRARLSIAGDPPIDVRVRNLSAGGMLVDIDGLVTPGDAVEGELRGVGPISGMVARVAPRQAGIAFDEAIDPTRARTPTGARTMTPAYLMVAETKRPPLRTLR